MNPQSFTVAGKGDLYAIYKALLALPLIGLRDKPLKWTIRIERWKRSNAQNALYWSWIADIAEETGNTAEAIHEHCKGALLPPQIVTLNGQTSEAPASSAKLKVDEMTDYMTRVHAWAATDLGIHLRHPEEMHLREAA